MRIVNRAARVLSLALLLTISAAAARAQSISASDSASPVQSIDISRFNQMVQTGQLTVPSPAVPNHDVVATFMQEHPNLPGFAQLVEGIPTDPAVFLTADGNYKFQVGTTRGTLRTVETMGQATILAQLAESIQASSDPLQQLALYQSLYPQYTALYSQLCTTSNTPPAGCANLVLPSQLINPSVLQGASLGVIKGALQSLGAQGLNIVKLVPFPPASGPVNSCSADIGNDSSLTDNVHYGDQTNSLGCTTPSPFGILGNFDWPNKDLLTCVKEQGARGTCHIFAATSGLEEIIARDTGNHVNLSEQDFMEHEKLIWGPAFYGDGGDSWTDLQHAATFGYKFAYEDQWDYNPSWDQPGKGYEYVHSCDHYPVPPEAGCSDSAPQAPEYCVAGLSFLCAFAPAVLSGTTSPYMSTGAVSIWDPLSPDVSVGLMVLELLTNNAVLLSFKVTPNFQQATAHGGFVSMNPKTELDDYKGGHVIHVVGYVDNSALASNSGTKKAPPAAGGGYFIIKNSWGACYGDAGYAYMPVAYLEHTATDVDVVFSESH